MKKALHETDEVFIFQKSGKASIWDFKAEEVIEAINDSSQENNPVILNLRKWIVRYLNEGITDELLDDLNSKIQNNRYSKYVIPADLTGSVSDLPKNAYIAQYDTALNPESYAADDFSKLLTSGEFKRLKICKLDDCDNIFLGPPQSKWCSKPCGSLFRVRTKRRRDSQ